MNSSILISLSFCLTISFKTLTFDQSEFIEKKKEEILVFYLQKIAENYFFRHMHFSHIQFCL